LESSLPECLDIPSNRIFTNITRNKVAVSSQRRYFIDTLIWAREIMKLSESAYRTVRVILPLPSEQILGLKFVNLKLGIQYGLTDPSGLDELIGMSQEVNGIDDINKPIPALLAVDAVASRPTITVDELGFRVLMIRTDQSVRESNQVKWHTAFACETLRTGGPSLPPRGSPIRRSRLSPRFVLVECHILLNS
jgi:hypothetical protein